MGRSTSTLTLSKHLYLCKKFTEAAGKCFNNKLKTTKITMAKQRPMTSFLASQIPSSGNSQKCLESGERNT